MKTAEDEAFEDIERRQGGFHAKRQAAIDKVNSDFDGEYIKYREAFPKGYTAPQPAQDPVAQWQKKHATETEGKWENTDEFDAKWWRDNSKGWEIRALYTTPPQRPWVGMTLDEIEELFQNAAGADEETDIRFARLIEAKLKEKNG